MKILDILIRAFGEADDREQAAILNQFGYSLLQACKYDEQKVEGQLCYAASHLDKHGKSLVLKLADFIKLSEEAGPSPYEENQ